MWGDISLWLWLAFPWRLVMLNAYSCTYWLFACHLWKNICFGTLPKFCFPDGTSGKEPTCQCRRRERCEFDPWVRKIPWRRAWQPSSVVLAGESHGQRSLVGTVHGIATTRIWLRQLSSTQVKTRLAWGQGIWRETRGPDPQRIASKMPAWVQPLLPSGITYKKLSVQKR